MFGVWILELVWSLELGAWSFCHESLDRPPSLEKNLLSGS
jgi:hypothetical protein